METRIEMTRCPGCNRELFIGNRVWVPEFGETETGLSGDVYPLCCVCEERYLSDVVFMDRVDETVAAWRLMDSWLQEVRNG